MGPLANTWPSIGCGRCIPPVGGIGAARQVQGGLLPGNRQPILPETRQETRISCSGQAPLKGQTAPKPPKNPPKLPIVSYMYLNSPPSGLHRLPLPRQLWTTRLRIVLLLPPMDDNCRPIRETGQHNGTTAHAAGAIQKTDTDYKVRCSQSALFHRTGRFNLFISPLLSSVRVAIAKHKPQRPFCPPGLRQRGFSVQPTAARTSAIDRSDPLSISLSLSHSLFLFFFICFAARSLIFSPGTEPPDSCLATYLLWP